MNFSAIWQIANDIQAERNAEANNQRRWMKARKAIEKQKQNSRKR